MADLTTLESQVRAIDSLVRKIELEYAVLNTNVSALSTNVASMSINVQRLTDAYNQAKGAEVLQRVLFGLLGSVLGTAVTYVLTHMKVI